jgi:hypothetical protein
MKTMTKKAKTHAQKPADDQPATVGEDLSQAGAEQETAALVEGDDRDAAAAGEEQQPDASDEAAGVDDGREEAQDEAGEHQDPAPAEEEDAGDGATGDDAALAADPADVPGPAGDPVNDSDGSADADPFDERIKAAAAAAWVSLRGIMPDQDEDQFEDRIIPAAIQLSIAALIRKIGDRATVPVIAQHLYLEKHKTTNTLSPWHQLTIDVFSHTLRQLDRFAQAEADKRAAEEAERNKPAPHHTRIEDTTLEETTGTFDKVF